MRYEVQTRFGNDNWENVWHDGEELTYFDTVEEALQEIDDLIEEMELQGMDYDIEDYRIMPVAKLKDLIEGDVMVISTTKNNAHRVLLDVAGGGYTVQQTAKAMEAYRELLAKGEVKIKKTKIKLEDYEDASN